jgi:excisionase family DNA binding protein
MRQLTVPDILTLEETAMYLRLPQETVQQQASCGNIPGRYIANTWRFLRSAIDEWLRHQDTRAVLLQQAGVLAYDEALNMLRATIYTQRQRPETESDE